MTFKNSTNSNIFISRSSTRDRWPVANLKQFESTVVQHYRQHGFPFYSLTTAQKHKELAKVMTFDRSKVIQNGQIEQSGMHGLALAWSYHPHQWSIRCGKMRTPREVFNDDELFRKAVAKRLKYGLNISDSAIRKALRTFTGSQGVSNFRPVAAASIYDRYLPNSGGTTWDMSSGFGGRLLGAMACPKVLKYIGTDPSTKTFKGLVRMKNELGRHLKREMVINLYRKGSESFRPKSESIDLCFTSPPYGSWERYSNEETQSCVRYSTNEAWLNDFMRRTLKNCHYGLKPNGYLVINIAATKSYPTLDTEFLRLAKDCGFRHVETLQLKLSRMMGTRRGSKDKHKREPAFVFRKVVA